MTTRALQETRNHNLIAAFNSGDFLSTTRIYKNDPAPQSIVDKGEILCYNLRNEQKQEVI